jgi:hypothetical protein
MTASAVVQRLAHGGEVLGRHPFIDSHRALAACAREFGHLADGVARGVGRLRTGDEGDRAVVRLSPGRCIVQLGPVALTLTWLRGSPNAIADGQLLVMVWRGAVAPRVELCPERPAARRASPAAVPLWEEVLVAAAASDAQWVWWPERVDEGAFSSAELAERCVERLRLAHCECAR